MLLKTLTEGSVSGTNTLTIDSQILGGVLISTDGTNAAVVVVRRNDPNGKIIFQMSTKTPVFASGPFSTEGTPTVYLSVSGTGGTAQLYQWIE